MGQLTDLKARPALAMEDIVKPADAKVAIKENPNKPYDKRRLSYAGTFSNPVKVLTIRALEWATAKITLLRLIRKFEQAGAPFGRPFWTKAIAHMGIDVQTP
ncbi:MAG: hypothetical protein ACRC6I_05015, partial [Paracoccaceae bacterium]